MHFICFFTAFCKHQQKIEIQECIPSWLILSLWATASKHRHISHHRCKQLPRTNLLLKRYTNLDFGVLERAAVWDPIAGGNREVESKICRSCYEGCSWEKEMDWMREKGLRPRKWRGKEERESEIDRRRRIGVSNN